MVDLLNEEDIENSDLDIEIFVKLDGLLYFSFSPNEVAFWKLQLNSAVTSLTVSIEATCTFSFLSDFLFLSTHVSHPSLRNIPGQPITGSLPVFSVMMVASWSLQISSIDRISLINRAGRTLSSYEKKTSMYEDQFMIQTAFDEISTPLPTTPFFMELEGKDSDGNIFWRVLPTLYSPSSIQVDVSASLKT